ncbi:hypothetical protein LTR99_003136 [Exophiala xenobiotica]|uniref:Major facilitator superfamily (MFS) profile domain-containing protein n=1 Tax=Vermiconidia calcicola TaxID=1690605 RepID=A0AAV9QCL2_9PEZI|nr:hypothetical protein LTR92_005877 [Exophiala xenobiotica]KAK5531598.1 hypothetical protein LTR23_009875 [Chaetothyriales sp. CCFEE 6169]KAK5538802.1 hypothetical protein LTR25_004346 [Vermiconidia calcicola]KAK5221841.1 hypothetical protein LTR72_006096 [Exophiala xenobiotica]KAK5294876.1 hypothetical protein LTR14_004044 [Exophiala xenobiotica]
MSAKEVPYEVEDAEHTRHGPKHLVHSHAHEEDVPGTVNLRAMEGDDTYLGQALYPVPAEDPNDPLQWANYKKTMILVICSIYSFLGNASLTGPAVYIGIFSEEFNITPTTASGLISWPNLAYGFGSWVLVPMYLKFGRRPVMLGSMLIFIAGLAGASRATTYHGLMAARVFHAFGSGVCEALPVQLVNDIFFLHERGKRIGYYTSATGPLYAGYMLAGGYSWRLYFYVVVAFASALLILAFFFVEETLYKRVPPPDVPIIGEDVHKEAGTVHQRAIPERLSFIQTLKPWSRYDPDAEFFMTMLRPFSYFLVPVVFWVITTYGLYIGIGALAFNYTFPIKIVAPPYNWKQTNSGLIACATFIAFALAAPLTFTSDRFAAYLTRRNNGIREAEMRLWVLLVPLLIGPAGLVVYGCTAEWNLHWVGYFFGVGLSGWCSYFFFTFTLAYAVDSYYANTSEMLIAMNFGKQAISTGMGSYVLNWVLKDGYAVVIGGIFGSVILLNNLALFVFLFWGKRIRRYTASSWLGRLHKRTQKDVMTH